MANLSAVEQLLLELLNRARLDPLGEAARFGIDLNQGLSPGQISAAPKQALAGNDLLAAAAAGHSAWMIDADVFSHTGVNGTTPTQRIQAAGYVLSGGWTTGENIAFRGTTAPSIDLTQTVIRQHEDLFRSAGHRVNILNGNFREVGTGVETGAFTYQGTTYQSSVLTTENFAARGTGYFITGVVYDDANDDAFYSVGEGRGGITVTVGAGATATAAAGGYEYGVAANAGLVQVTFSGGGLAQPVTVSATVAGQNVKIDLVDAATVAAAGSLALGANALHGRLLGIADWDLAGNALANELTGNAGGNRLAGGGGDDTIAGGAGSDVAAFSGARSDYLVRRRAQDLVELSGPDGTDRLSGIEALAFGGGPDLALSLLLAPPGTQPDADGDARSEILLARTGGLALWYVDGIALQTGGLVAGSLNAGWEALTAGDFDGDGNGDLLLGNGSSLGIWLLDGTQVLGGGGIGALAANWTVAGSGDFDGDGRSDLLLHNAASNLLAVWRLNGAQIAGGGTVAPLGAGWAPAGIGDFDADGRDDVLLYKAASQQLAIWRMNGSQLLGGALIGTLGAGWAPSGIGDFDGDGTADILLTRGQQIARWLIRDGAVAGGAAIGTLGTGWSTRGTGDFDGDGQSDILLSAPTGDGRVRVAEWLIQGGQVAGGGMVAELGAGWDIALA